MAKITVDVNEKSLVTWILSVSMLLPILYLYFHTGSAVKMSSIVTRVFSAACGAMAIVYFATMRFSDEIKTRANLIVAICILFFSAKQIYEYRSDVIQLKASISDVISINGKASFTHHDDVAINEMASVDDIHAENDEIINTASIFKGIKPIQEKMIKNSSIVNNKMASLPLGEILSPDSISSQDGINASRKRIGELDSLIRQRQKVVAEYWFDVENYFKTVKVSEELRKDVMNGYLQSKPKTVALYKELDDSQFKLVGQTNLILDLCEKNLGHFKLDNGQLIFENDETLNEYREKVARLVKLANESDAVVSKLKRYYEEENKISSKQIDAL